MKLSSPFSGNTIILTQTYHMGSNNMAIDCEPVGAKAGDPVLAPADGVLQAESLNLGAYCTFQLDNSPLKIFDVHTYNWGTVNKHFLRGEKIGELAPTSVSKEAIHLHFGLGIVNGVYPGIMDYMDKSIVFKPGFSDMTDWFNSDGTLKKELFKDLNYEDTSMVGFKIGDKIKFTAVMNRRTGAGTGFDGTGINKNDQYAVGSVVTIKDGPRSSQNKLFNKGNNDSYTWYDTVDANGSTGWVADLSKFVVTTDTPTVFDLSTAPSSPADTTPVTPSEAEQIATLKSQLSDANSASVNLQGQINTLNEQVASLQASDTLLRQLSSDISKATKLYA
jgi:hypothetical protein